MFFGNPDLLQKSLHTDLNTLIKNVKAREDQYLTLLQYNKNSIASLAEIQNVTFVTDVINMHKAFANSSQAAHDKILAQQQEIKQKYVCVTSGEPNITKLMGRVTSRVLEICQASYDKGKALDPILNQKFVQFKDILLQNLSEGNKINIQLVLQTIIEYCAQKNNKEIQRLNQIIKILINGQFQCLNEIYTQPKPQPRKSISPQKRQVPKEHKKSPSIDKLKQKQKEQRIRRQQQARNIEKTKKKKAKVAKQLIANVYSTMDLAKQQFAQDMNFTLNPQEKRKRLYEEIFSRNKFNHEQIIQFQSKKDQFEQKVRQFKQNMVEQSRKIQQTLVFVINKPVQHKQHKIIAKQTIRKQTKSESGENQQELDSIRHDRLDRVFRRKQKKQTAKGQSPQFVKQVVFSAMQSTQEAFQHIKFDAKNQQIFSRSNRARLPQIPGRSSLDNRYQGKSLRGGSQKKEQKRINIMKNVEIGMVNTEMSKNIVNLNHNKRSPRDWLNVQPMFESVVNVHQDLPGTNGLDFTFYVRKKVTKFYQTKNNFML